jgi:cellulose synthase/poly-beta-1,6-N-acetylglucosamine synthase-like glycosyltransferase
VARPGQPELSVIVLCYRAEEQARNVVLPLYEQLEQQPVPYELILVANYWDASDSTPEVAADLARSRETVRVVSMRKAGAMGWDMRSGLHEARGSYLVVIDGDGQVPVQYALEAYRVLKESGAAIVKGRRFLREDGTVRSLTSLGYNLSFRLLFRTQGLWDINGRPKGLTRTAYERLALTTDDWFTDAEMLLKARRQGVRVVEFPVRFLRNEVRGSFVGLDTVWEFVRNMILWRAGRHPAQRAPAPAVSQPAREKSRV